MFFFFVLFFSAKHVYLVGRMVSTKKNHLHFSNATGVFDSGDPTTLRNPTRTAVDIDMLDITLGILCVQLGRKVNICFHFNDANVL